MYLTLCHVVSPCRITCLHYNHYIRVARSHGTNTQSTHINQISDIVPDHIISRCVTVQNNVPYTNCILFFAGDFHRQSCRLVKRSRAGRQGGPFLSSKPLCFYLGDWHDSAGRSLAAFISSTVPFMVLVSDGSFCGTRHYI